MDQELVRPVKKLAIVLCAAQLLTAVGALCRAIIDIESIVGTGPALALIGLFLAVVVRRNESWFLLLFALSAPLVTALGALMIAVFHWGPPEAEAPITALLYVYALAMIPASVVAAHQILRGNVVAVPASQKKWQFSLRSLLVTMTGVCVFAALGQYLARMAIPDFPIVFGTFAFVSSALSAVILRRFFRSRRAGK
jgi:hypothetical protein